MTLQLPQLPEGHYVLGNLYLDGFTARHIFLPAGTVYGTIDEPSCGDGCCTMPVDYDKEFDEFDEEQQQEILETIEEYRQK